MSDRPSSHSHSKSHSNSHSHSPSSDSRDSRRSSSHRHSHSHSDRSYSSSKSSKSYSRDSRSRSRDYSRGSSHGVGLPKIFITKLDPYVRTKDIEREFGKFGEIKKTNLKRGFAFVEYYNKEDAKEAIRKLNNKSRDKIFKSAQTMTDTSNELSEKDLTISKNNRLIILIFNN